MRWDDLDEAKPTGWFSFGRFFESICRSKVGLFFQAFSPWDSFKGCRVFTSGTLPKTNIAHENPPFWWCLPGKIGFSWAMLVSGRVHKDEFLQIFLLCRFGCLKLTALQQKTDVHQTVLHQSMNFLSLPIWGLCLYKLRVYFCVNHDIIPFLKACVFCIRFTPWNPARSRERTCIVQKVMQWHTIG